MVEAIHVLRTYCPFWQRTVYELWNGFQPVISANNYLRSNLALSDSTLANKAYLLTPFFRFLKRNSVEFFDLGIKALNPFIQHFRNELLFRVRALESTPRSRNQGGTDGGLRPISYTHAHSVLTEVSRLCEWWGLFKIPAWRQSFEKGKRRDHFKAPARFVPDSFRLVIPKARRGFRENHVLEPAEVEAIWDYVTSAARPTRPPILVKHPSGPKRGWAPSQASAWKHAHLRYRKRLAWFHRQQMLWALLFGSAMRRSEAPLLMATDVQFYGVDAWVSLRLRKSTESLGRAKSGPRSIFIGWDSRIVSAWQNWSRSRQVLLVRWMKNTGKPDHGMFLTNRDGGPLTVDGMTSLFESLNARFLVFGGEFLEDQFQLHAHAIRHTVEALFKEWKVPLEIRQRHLGHRKPETTDLYGKVFRKTYVGFLSKLDTRLMTEVSEGTRDE